MSVIIKKVIIIKVIRLRKVLGDKISTHKAALTAAWGSNNKVLTLSNL